MLIGAYPVIRPHFHLPSFSARYPPPLSSPPRRTSTRFWTLTWYWLCAFIFPIVGQLVGNGVKDHLRAAAVAASASAFLLPNGQTLSFSLHSTLFRSIIDIVTDYPSSSGEKSRICRIRRIRGDGDREEFEGREGGRHQEIFRKL